MFKGLEKQQSLVIEKQFKNLIQNKKAAIKINALRQGSLDMDESNEKKIKRLI